MPTRGRFFKSREINHLAVGIHELETMNRRMSAMGCGLLTAPFRGPCGGPQSRIRPVSVHQKGCAARMWSAALRAASRLL